MKSVSPTDHARSLETLAKNAFANHILVKSEPGRWYIRRTDAGCHAAEILTLGWNRILVHGDCPDVLYGRSSYSGDRLIPWLAQSDVDYLASKVLAGKAYEWRPEVALWWVDWEATEVHKELSDVTDGEVDGKEKARAEHLLEELRDIRYGLIWGAYEDEFRKRVYEASDDGEWGMDAGRVPSSDVFYTREAARTLMRLLGRNEEVTPTETP